MFLVQVKDVNSLSATQQFSLTILNQGGGFTITTNPQLPAGQIGAQYAQTLMASGAPTPYTWSVTGGSLPAGLTLSQGGVLSGAPTTLGTSLFTIQVVGSGAAANEPPTASQMCSLTINPAPLLISPPAMLAPSTVGVPYTRTLQATGGAPPTLGRSCPALCRLECRWASPMACSVGPPPQPDCTLSRSRWSIAAPPCSARLPICRR